MDILALIEILAGYYAFSYGSRNVSKQNYFIMCYSPTWLRRILLLPRDGKLSLVGIILQVIVSLLTITCLLNWFGINVFSAFGPFNNIFKLIARGVFFYYGLPLTIYTVIIGIIFKKF